MSARETRSLAGIGMTSQRTRARMIERLRGEIGGQCVEQIVVCRLACPRRGQSRLRFLPRHIERIHRVNDAES